MRPAWQVFTVFLRLGLTSFGGPVAHLGYFRTEFVTRRRWLSEAEYADLVALCSFLPGPASSQVGMAVGLGRAGLPGLLAAWLGFTLPSAALMAGFALGVGQLGDLSAAGWLRGLLIVAVAVVAQAVAGMARTLAPDAPRLTIAAAGAALVLLVPGALAQLLALAVAGLIGWRFLAAAPQPDHVPTRVPIRRRTANIALILFTVLLFGLPLLAYSGPALALFAGFYRAGALVFGGGHVVLPLLEAVVVPPGWLGQSAFVAGYGAAQAVPGPLFSFSAYLGAASRTGLAPLWGAAVALVGLFLPSALLIVGALPYWDALRARPAVQRALAGVNAAVVGLLIAALYSPVWTSAIRTPADFALALAAFVALQAWRAPPWAVVLACAGVGWVWL